MTKKICNTSAGIELADGTTVRATLTYRWLLALRSHDRKVYDRYNTVYNKKPEKREELDNIDILYAAYLCALLEDGAQDSAMSYDDFLDAVTCDRASVNESMRALLAPNRRGDSATPSE